MATGLAYELLHAEMVRIADERGAKREEDRQMLAQAAEQDAALLKASFSQHNSATWLENIGYKVGYAMAEKVSRDAPKLSSELEVMKFICKDFWVSCFSKQVDNLRTNHQGVYVVLDKQFLTVVPFADDPRFLDSAMSFLSFPCGLIRGALAALGIAAIVTATTEMLPNVKFHIQIHLKSARMEQHSHS